MNDAVMEKSNPEDTSVKKEEEAEKKRRRRRLAAIILPVVGCTAIVAAVVSGTMAGLQHAEHPSKVDDPFEVDCTTPEVVKSTNLVNNIATTTAQRGEMEQTTLILPEDSVQTTIPVTTKPETLPVTDNPSTTSVQTTHQAGCTPDMCPLGQCVEELQGYTCACNNGAYNVAVNKVVFQSSVSNGGLAALAIDGNYYPYFAQGSCIETLPGHEEWWKVDLGEIHCIDSVTIINRQDMCCSNTLLNAVVLMQRTVSATELKYCVPENEEIRQDIRMFTCGGPARYVTIKLEGTTEMLSFCEVEIIAPPRRHYELVTQTKSYLEAKLECDMRGAQLATIRNEDQQLYIENLLSQSDIPWDIYGVIIGLNDQDNEGDFIYFDGSTTDTYGYSNWYVDEPNNGGGWGAGEDCVELAKDWFWKWNDIDCHESTRYFVCEYSDPPFL